MALTAPTSADASFFHWISKSLEDFTWYKLSKFFDVFVEPYTVNYGVNKLYEVQQAIDRRAKTEMLESADGIFNSCERDKLLRILLTRLGAKSISRKDVHSIIYQCIHIIKLYILDGDDIQAKTFLNQIILEITKNYIRACCKEEINPAAYSVLGKDTVCRL